MNKIMDYTEKEFRLKKSKLLIALLLGATIVYFSGLLVINPEKYINFMARDSFKIKIVGIIGLIFFGFSSIIITFLLLSSLRKSIGIVINKKGIYSNYTMPSVGLVKWQDISSIQIHNEEKTLSSKKNDIIIIHLKNPYVFFKNPNLNAVEKMLFTQQINKYGSPVILNSLLLNCKFKVLEEAVLEGWEKYKYE